MSMKNWILGAACALNLFSNAMAVEKKITEDDARRIALTKITGTIKEVELENEHGREIYSVEIVTKDSRKMEVNIDTTTGDVVNIEDETNKKD